MIKRLLVCVLFPLFLFVMMITLIIDGVIWITMGYDDDRIKITDNGRNTKTNFIS